MNIVLRENIKKPFNEITVSLMIDQSVERINDALNKIFEINCINPDTGKAMTYPDFYQNYALFSLENELSKNDKKTKKIFNKLFYLVHQRLQTHSLASRLIFAMLSKKVNQGNAKLFVGSFVLPVVKPLIEDLKAQQPGALQDEEIWEIARDVKYFDRNLVQ